MVSCVKRIFVEKKSGFRVEADNLADDLRQNLMINTLDDLRLINRYDVSGITQKEFEKSIPTIFSENNIDDVYIENLPFNDYSFAFAVEYLPGQYDQRADSAAECIQLLVQGDKPKVLSAKVILLYGDINEEDFLKIKSYYINPVDSREALMEKPETLELDVYIPEDVATIEGLIDFSDEKLQEYMNNLGMAMTFEDLKFCRDYFKYEEKRNPTITELRVIDTYWSDHCRHTTFLTEIKGVSIEEGLHNAPVKRAYEDYLSSRQFVYGEKNRAVSLMDIATIGMKELRKRGLLEDLDVSDEINACSIKVPVNIDGVQEDWLVMFKNETHNHPTEIEPFGGAATCLGGAIRDPLSGRSYVYQAMRLTGSGDPRVPVKDTLRGKLPQRKITTVAAHGYSSYGNQIGLATGQVAEVYDEGFIAKRMEVGAVIAAAPAKNVVRKSPENGDKIILLGGRTGRDGCGGATGSSKQHTEESILNCGAEVQKGNAPTERKIQRLFRNEKVSTLIKKCNDFGAGGVAVAIGELAPGIEVNLDLVPKKYEGLDGTELAISESQERMAVVVAASDVDKFVAFALEENLEAAVVAEVNDTNRLSMLWRGKKIVDISRVFLDTNGVTASTKVSVKAPIEDPYFNKNYGNDIKKSWVDTLSDLNICSQKGLSERFDSTIGSGTVIMPFGGFYQKTPAEGMVAKIPLLKGDTNTATIMTYGYNPKIGKWSAFHGALYAVVEAATKVAALGGNFRKIRLSFQEYFEKLGKDEAKWGKPFSALLGALHAQKELGIPAIGGKDSMSGTFNDISVPPTLAAFAVCVIDDCNKTVSQEFKNANNNVVYLRTKRNDEELPCFEQLKDNFDRVYKLADNNNILSSCSIRHGGICEAVSKMSFGNKIGLAINENISEDILFEVNYGSLIIEFADDIDINEELKGLDFILLGKTTDKNVISYKDVEMSLDELLNAWETPLENIFASKTKDKLSELPLNLYKNTSTIKPSIKLGASKPKVFIPVFPGSNCEYDSARAFEKAGGEVSTFVFKNADSKCIEDSIIYMVNEINKSNIVMLPGGFSAGDEPDGSGKFIATVFRNPRIKEAVTKLLQQRDGLMLGICNGFQALIKLGLVPYGEIRDIDETCPTLTYNEIGRHVSCMVNTRTISKLSPWFSNSTLGEINTIPVSHGEGRFVGESEVIGKLFENGQIAAQYVDLNGNPTMNMPFNPNGSFMAIEAITSPDGRVLGKMGHSERTGINIFKNIIGNKEQKLFQAGIDYFK